MTLHDDHNFDNLSHRFQKNIYHTAKGRIRLSVLWRDFIEEIPEIETGGLTILDAGAGQGNMALQLAQKNHQLTLCDVSTNMLQDAKRLFESEKNAEGFPYQAEFIHSSVQQLPQHINRQFDVVLFHAVLEWLAEPQETLKQLIEFIRPGGYLSLMFYSRSGLIYQNLTRGNFDYILNDTLSGKGKTLTPVNPQNPDDVCRWLAESGLTILVKSGVRVFYDSISRERRKQISEDDLLELEKKFSRIEPYCSLARYVHIVCRV